MKTNHSPGPWLISECGSFIEQAMPDLRNTHDHICDFRSGLSGRYDVNAGNARLIAAAPELLEALKCVLAILQQPAAVALDNPIVSGDLALARETITRAIQKATP